MLKLATWNVNSLRVRLPQVLDWLACHQPDVLALQETKVEDALFPFESFLEQGYHACFEGQKKYNGVAVLARRGVPPQVLATELPDYPDPQRRVLAVVVTGLCVLNLYVPNGSEPGCDKYRYKLEWLSRLQNYVQMLLQQHERLLVLGDFNIAPEDRDVHDPEAWVGKILVSDDERNAFQTLLQQGLKDCFRLFDQDAEQYSWWDYRGGGFRRNHGLRIDHILVSTVLSRCCRSCYMDREPRAWPRPSDHCPVVAEFAT